LFPITVKLLLAVQKECASPPHLQVRHCTWSDLPGLPLVSTARDKHWGEKNAWVQGYSTPLYMMRYMSTGSWIKL